MHENASLSNLRVLITGAAAGLGRSLARTAAARGANLILVDIDDASSTHEDVVALGAACEVHKVDVSDYEQMSALALTIEKKHGMLNVLVNNAAASGGAGTLESANPAAVKRMFEVNVLGVFNGIHAFGRALRRAAAAGEKAYLMNVGSEHSLGVPPYVPAVSAYTASKYAILGLTETAARDFEGSGVQACLLAPGWILTERMQAMIDSSAEWEIAIKPYAQSTEFVSECAWNGMLVGRSIIPTNPATREFALEHGRWLMEVAQQLPRTSTSTIHPQHGSGDSSKCPISHIGQ